MLTTFVEDRDPQPQMFDATEKLYDLLIHPDMWCVGYFYWELALLDALGFGLDLSKCVVTGDTENLPYLSPKSGCAVSPGSRGMGRSPLTHAAHRDGKRQKYIRRI